MWVYAPPSTTFTISQGVYPQSSFTIWRESSIYFSKNSFGELYTSGSNFCVVVQTTLDALGSIGGEVFIKAGQYDVSSHIYIPSNTKICGEGYATNIHQVYENMFGAIFAVIPAPPVLEANWGTCPLIHDITIENMRIDSELSEPRGNGVSFLAVNHLILRNLWLENLNQGFESHGRAWNVVVDTVFINNTDTWAFSLQPSFGNWDDLNNINIDNININNANLEDLGEGGIWVSGLNVNVDHVTLNGTNGFGMKVSGVDIDITNTLVNNTEDAGFNTYLTITDVQNGSYITFDKCTTLNAGKEGFKLQLSDNVKILNSEIYNVGNADDGISIEDTEHVFIMGCTIIDDRDPQLMVYDIAGYNVTTVDFISVIGNDFIQGKNDLGLDDIPNQIIQSNFNITDFNTLP